MPKIVEFTDGTEEFPKRLGFVYSNHGNYFEAFDLAHPEKGVVTVPIKNDKTIVASKIKLMAIMCAGLTESEKLVRISII